MSALPVPGPVLTVMTVNIHKGYSFLYRRFILPELREAVRRVGADLVFLQEVLGRPGPGEDRRGRGPTGPHYEFLADEIWPQFAYGRNVAYPGGHHGNALMSKYPIVHDCNHDVSVRGPERRGVLHCIVRLQGPPGEVHALCVHLGLRESHRARQLALLCETVRAQVPPNAPLIVAGDFNDWRQRAGDILWR